MASQLATVKVIELNYTRFGKPYGESCRFRGGVYNLVLTKLREREREREREVGVEKFGFFFFFSKFDCLEFYRDSLGDFYFISLFSATI